MLPSASPTIGCRGLSPLALAVAAVIAALAQVSAIDAARAADPSQPGAQPWPWRGEPEEPAATPHEGGTDTPPAESDLQPPGDDPESSPDASPRDGDPDPDTQPFGGDHDSDPDAGGAPGAPAGSATDDRLLPGTHGHSRGPEVAPTPSPTPTPTPAPSASPTLRADESAFRARWMTRPLPLSRNNGLDYLVNFPRFNAPDTLPAGALAVDFAFNFDSQRIVGGDGEFVEGWLGIDYGIVEWLQFRVQFGLAGWAGGQLDRFALGMASNVGTTVNADLSDIVLGAKAAILRAGDAGPFGLGARVEFKLPVGSTANFVTSGDVDIGLSVLTELDLKPVRVFGMVAATFTTGDGASVFIASRRPTEQVFASAALGASIAVLDWLAVLASTEFHTDYRGSEEALSIEAGVRVLLPFTLPISLSGGFSYNLIGDSEFSFVLAVDVVIALPPIFD